MKNIGVIFFTMCAIFMVSCSGKKEYAFKGENPNFTAFVTMDVNDKGILSPCFALNDYRIFFSKQKDAIDYFNRFVNEYKKVEKDEGEGMGGRIVMYHFEEYDMKTVGSKKIRFVDLNSDPNYAVPDN